MTRRWIFGHTGSPLHLAAENRLTLDAPPLSAHVIARLCDGVRQRYTIADHAGVDGDPGPDVWGLPVCAACRAKAAEAPVIEAAA